MRGYAGLTVIIIHPLWPRFHRPLYIPVLRRVKFGYIKDATRFICNANGTDGEVSLHSVPCSQVGNTTVYGFMADVRVVLAS